MTPLGALAKRSTGNGLNRLELFFAFWASENSTVFNQEEKN